MNSKTYENQIDENYFSDLAHHSPVGIFLIQDEKVIYQNPRSIEMTKSCLGLPMDQAYRDVHPDDVDKLRNAYQGILTGSCESVEVEFRLYSSNRESNTNIRWILFFAKAVIHEGQPAVLINMADHSKTKEDAELSDRINQLVYMDQTASRVAHEIRNPLTAIYGYLFTLGKLVDQKFLKPDDLQLMQSIIPQIEDSSNSIESAIHKLMKIARINISEEALVDVNKSLKEVIDFMADAFRQNGITLEQSLEKDLPICYADSLLIQKAIINLISNACNAMEQNDGPKKIGVKSFYTNNRIFISIADSGPGVPLEYKKSMFDPILTSEFGNTGIGFKIVQKIVTLHHGSVDATDSKWEGNEIIISLPIDKRVLPR